MNDIDDAQIKTEIDKIMKGVRNTMQKVDALTPKKEVEPENKEDAGELIYFFLKSRPIFMPVVNESPERKEIVSVHKFLSRMGTRLSRLSILCRS